MRVVRQGGKHESSGSSASRVVQARLVQAESEEVVEEDQVASAVVSRRRRITIMSSVIC